jgi:transposase
VERLPICAPLRQAQVLVHAFRTMGRARQGKGWWVERVRSSGLTNLVSFANGLEREGSLHISGIHTASCWGWV